jgi:O-antigen ligase
MIARTGQRSSFLCNVTGFLLAFRVCLTYVFFQADPQLGAATTIGVTLLWLMITFGYSVVNPPPRTDPLTFPKPLVWIAMYLGLGAASLLWTGAGSVAIAACYWSVTAADVIIVYVLLCYEPVEQRACGIMYGFISGAAAVAIIAWVIPATDDLRLGHEEFLHPNLIGFEFAIAALVAGFLAHENKNSMWLAGGFVVTLIRTLSKGAIVGFAFAGLYFLLRGFKLSPRARAYLGFVSTVVLLVFWGLLETYLDLYTQGSNLETLTGRTYIWTQSLDIAMEKPWLGHGFDSFRWAFPPFDAFQPWQAHNEVIQQFFAYGIVGVLVVCGAYWTFYRQARLCAKTSLRSLAIAILILTLVRGLVDTDRFELCFPLWLMTLLAAPLAHNRTPPPVSPS